MLLRDICHHPHTACTRNATGVQRLSGRKFGIISRRTRPRRCLQYAKWGISRVNLQIHDWDSLVIAFQFVDLIQFVWFFIVVFRNASFNYSHLVRHICTMAHFATLVPSDVERVYHHRRGRKSELLLREYGS